MQPCIRDTLGTSHAHAWLYFALAAAGLSSCDIHERTLEVEARDGGGVSGRFSTQSSGNGSGGTSSAVQQGGTVGSSTNTDSTTTTGGGSGSTTTTGGGSDSIIPDNAGSGGAFVGHEGGSAGVLTSNPVVGGTGGIITTATTGGTTPSGGTSSTNGGGPARAGSGPGIAIGGGGTGVAMPTGGAATGGAATGGAATGGAATGGAPSCLIGGVSYQPNANNPANECQYCRPEIVVDNWTPRAEGTGCERNTKVCHGGKCELGCFIDNKFRKENELDSGNCRSCQPAVSTTQWTNLRNRTGCAKDQICYDGQCKAGCYIGSKFYDPDKVNPDNPCQSCQILSSLDNWSALTTVNGNACSSGKICRDGVCEAACYIGTTFHGADENDTATPCGRCIPAKKTDGWSLRNDCFKSLAVGNGHSCALVDTQAVWCWGRNHLRQLGDTLGQDSTKPVKVVNTSSVLALAAGAAHTCAIRDQAVYCWGGNSSGQIGNGVLSEFQNLPDRVLNLSLVAGVSAGALHTCALDTAGAAQCWGDNQSGQLGAGTSDLNSARPMTVVGIDASSEDTKATSIALGATHSCALMLSGVVLCWGKNNAGQLGNGNNQDQRSPVQVKNLNDEAVAIAAGYSHTCAVLTNGEIRCWGSNGSGELGDGKTLSSNVPVQVGSTYVDNAVAITAGQNFTCARLKTGALKCWGNDASDQLGNGGGDGNVQSTPVAVSSISTALMVSAGANHACAGLSGGGLQCWGDNTYGQLGDGSKILRSEPVDVLGFKF